MRHMHELVRTVHLDPGQLLILEAGHEGRVRVLVGGAWLTEAGVSDDAFLGAGQDMATQGGRAVVQAEGRVALQITRGRRVPARPWQRLRALAARWQMGPVPQACA
jgi:hypothetical protein